MERDATRLRRLLLDQGLSGASIDAAWPGWWAEDDASGENRARLRRALSRRLGLSLEGLAGDRVEFVWRDDDARFKHLRSEAAPKLAALISFGTAVGGYLLDALGPARDLPPIDPHAIRNAMLSVAPWIDLSGLLEIAWGLGIPVAHLRVFPLAAKEMHAMVVKQGGRTAILLGRDASYPAPLAFTLAHELGHVAAGHLGGASALIDFDPGDEHDADERDTEEREADRFALTLLTGSAEPVVEPGASRFSGVALARAAIAAGRERSIEPGTLALVLGHQAGRFDIANQALAAIYDRPRPMWQAVNAFAAEKLARDQLDPDAAEYLARVLGWSSS